MTNKTVNRVCTNKEIKAKLLELYEEIFNHNGYGEIKIDIRILHRGQKEVIIHCGKQYRFVVDFNTENRGQTAKRFKTMKGWGENAKD